MAAGSNAGGEKSFSGAGTSMGLSAGARVVGVERIPVRHSIRIQSALVETRSTRLTLTSFLNSCKSGRSRGTAPIIVLGTARIVVSKTFTVVRFMAVLLVKGS